MKLIIDITVGASRWRGIDYKYSAARLMAISLLIISIISYSDGHFLSTWCPLISPTPLNQAKLLGQKSNGDKPLSIILRQYEHKCADGAALTAYHAKVSLPRHAIEWHDKDAGIPACYADKYCSTCETRRASTYGWRDARGRAIADEPTRHCLMRLNCAIGMKSILLSIKD